MTARTSKVLKWVGFALLIAVVEFVMFCIMTFVNYKSLFRSGYMERTEFTSEETAIIQRGMYLLREEEIIEPLSLTIAYSWQSSDNEAWLLFAVKEGKEKRFNEYIAAKYNLWKEYQKMIEEDQTGYSIWYNDIKYTVAERTQMQDKEYVEIYLYEAENGEILYFWKTSSPEDEIYTLVRKSVHSVKITPDQANGNRFPHKDYK